MPQSSIVVVVLVDNNECKQALWQPSIVWLLLETNKHKNLMRLNPLIDLAIYSTAARRCNMCSKESEDVHKMLSDEIATRSSESHLN